MRNESPQVAIVMGSDSDWPKIKQASAALDEFGVAYEVRVMSAHRTPQAVAEYATTAVERGLRVIIAAAGGAAHLAGVIAAHTTLPVIGLPVPTPDLGGLDSLKSFCLRSMRRQGQADPLRRPRGVLLLSPPGCGKSQFAKTLGNEVGRPTITLDVGSLYGSLVGETERNVRQALQTIDAMAPCICFIDELEKGLSGSGSSGQTDSGVSARLFGSLLTWMNDRTSDVYLMGTCNDIGKLPPEFTRAERWDAVYFIDLPSREQRQAIWDIYVQLFELDANQSRPKDDAWTGAEIRACCRLAALLDVPLTAAAEHVVPVAVTSAESVERLRQWASGRCLDADAAGIYTHKSARTSKRRKVTANPSNN